MTSGNNGIGKLALIAVIVFGIAMIAFVILDGETRMNGRQENYVPITIQNSFYVVPDLEDFVPYDEVLERCGDHELVLAYENRTLFFYARPDLTLNILKQGVDIYICGASRWAKGVDLLDRL